MKDLKDLGQHFSSQADVKVSSSHSSSLLQGKPDAKGRFYGTGRRKTSAARVWIKPGKGQFIINKKNVQEYFSQNSICALAQDPLKVSELLHSYDVWCTVKGSGLMSQAGAVRHGLSRALVLADPLLRTVLKPHGFLTRDSRMVERKKYGLRKARRSTQFSKR